MTHHHSKAFLLVAAIVIIAILLGNFETGSANAQTTDLLTNLGFESGASQTPSGWSETGTVAASKSDAGSAHSGSFKATHWSTSAYTVYTYQTKTGLTNGTYTLKAWVKSGGGQTTARMEAKIVVEYN